MRLDVFTQVPHAFGWLTEQKPLATVLGTELELRLFNYRDTTPLRAGQVDDTPYGGGAGMVLRVDVVAAALEAVYGDARPARVIALTPQGRQLDQALVEELAAEPRSRFSPPASRASTPGSSTTSAPTRSRSARTSSPAASCPRWCCSTRSPAGFPALCGRLRRARELQRRARGGVEYPHYTRPPSFRGWEVPDVLLSGNHGRIDAWRTEQSRDRSLA